MARASRSKRSRRCGLAAKEAVEDLDRDGPIEARIAGAIDLAHASSADERDDFIRAEAHAGCQGHGLALSIIRVRSRAASSCVSVVPNGADT